MAFKIVLMSDIHIAPKGDLVYSIDTAKRLEMAIASINNRHADANFCVVAGDLTDKGKYEAYENFESIAADLNIPRHYMIGNHDLRVNFKEFYPDYPTDENGFIQRIIDIEDYRIILLDSVDDGALTGILCPKRMDWLKKRLDETVNRSVIVCIHHHVMPLNTHSDRIILANGSELVDLLGRHKNVKHVISGHVHITTTGIWRGIPCTTIGGNHYTVNLHLPNMPGDRQRLQGPGQYAVLMADGDHVVIHFEDFLNGYPEITGVQFKSY